MSLRRLALLAALALLPSAAAASDAASLLRQKGVEFCFGRVYDADHLKRHKRQDLSALYVFKTFTTDPMSEDKPVTRERAAAMDRHAGVQNVTVIRRYRDGQTDDWHLECRKTKPRVFECTAGSEEFADYQLELRASGERLFARHGLDEKEIYRVEPRPAAECLAWRDKVRPDWVGQGQPLRARFAQRAPVCHATQAAVGQVASLSFRVDRPVEIEDSDLIPHTMMRVTVELKLRDGTTRIRYARCDSGGYEFICQYGKGGIRLVPAGEGKIAVFEGNFEKGEDERSPVEAFFDVSLPPDERRFVVGEREATACPQD